MKYEIPVMKIARFYRPVAMANNASYPTAMDRAKTSINNAQVSNPDYSQIKSILELKMGD